MLHVVAAMALITIIVVIIFGENFAILPFTYTFLAGVIPGQLLLRLTPSRVEDYTLTEMMWIVTIGWILCSSLAGLPFYLIAHDMTSEVLEVYKMSPFLGWVNSHFEGLSGITSTGLTVTIAESELPFSIQWWRTFLQWIGGIGIIVFVSTFYKKFKPVSDHYSQGHEKEEILPDVEVRWYKIWWIYLIFTALSILILWVQGLSFWEALNHAMTGISTGGFTITDASVQEYDNGLLASLIFIMVLGALNFNLFHLLFRQGNWKKFITDQQHIFFIAFCIAGTAFLYLENEDWKGITTAGMDLAFTMTSALATCGFLSEALVDWPDTSLLFLAFAMLIGGATASTAGGLKILRLLLLLKGNIINTLEWAFSYDKKLEYRWLDTTFSPEDSLKLYRNVATFHFFWGTFFILVTYLLVHNVPDQYRLSEVIFEMASAFGTTGLTVGITGHELNSFAKIDLMAAMLVGRLELIPFVVIFASILKSRLTTY